MPEQTACARDGEYRPSCAWYAVTRSSCCGEQIAAAFGDDPQGPATDQLARFALAAIDGAFVACQADRGATLEQLLQPLDPRSSRPGGPCWPGRTDDRGLRDARGPARVTLAGQVY